MNRTIKDATVKRFFYERHDQVRQHLADFVSTYDFERRLKIFKGLTIRIHMQMQDKRADRFTLDPTHQAPEPNS